MYLNRVIIFTLCLILKIHGFELHSYLEHHDNVLFGFDTPIFIATRYGNNSDVVYECAIKQSASESFRLVSLEDCASTNDKVKNHFSSSAQKYKRRSIVNTVYPEILIVVDYKSYVSHGRDLSSLVTYMTAFWNGVDLRFRQMSHPNIRLNIAGLIIVTDPDAEPYLKLDGDYFHADSLPLEDLNNNFQGKHLIHYDIIVAVSGRPLKKRLSKKGLGGLAYTKGACNGNLSTAIFYDIGGFEGIIHATQKLGILFGAFYDGEKSTGSFGEWCNPEDGYIMSNKWGNENKIHWSNCSIKAMQDYLKSKDAGCLINKPIVNKPHHKRLPGEILDGKAQCTKRFSGLTSYEKKDCTVLHCYKCYLWGVFCSKYATNFIPPAEGTSCGKRSICLNGKCVEYT